MPQTDGGTYQRFTVQNGARERLNMKNGLSGKQQRVLKLLRYFGPVGTVDAGGAVEDQSGLTPEEAYFARTDKGEKGLRVTDLLEFEYLLRCHNGMALQITQWRDGFKEGWLFLQDFVREAEPDPEIRNAVYQIAVKTARTVAPKWWELEWNIVPESI